MKAAPRKGSRSRLIPTPPPEPTYEELPESPMDRPPDMQSAEFDAKFAEELERIAGIGGQR